MSERVTRTATEADAAACAEIYAHYVERTPVTFETEPPSVEDMAGRIRSSLARHAWLVMEDDGRVVGYAYASAFNPRAAYGWTCFVSVYLEDGLRRTGAGRTLYTELLRTVRERGHRRAIAWITQPNDASTGLHRAFGFEDIGVMRRVGWKHGTWHDVATLQLDLAPDADSTAPPAGIV